MRLEHCPPRDFLLANNLRRGGGLFLEDRAGKVVGVEVKASATLGGHDARGLQELADAVGKNWVRGIILYAGREVVPFASNLHGIPMASLWRDPRRAPDDEMPFANERPGDNSLVDSSWTDGWTEAGFR